MKKKIRRGLALLLAAAMTLSQAACGKQESGESGQAQTEEKEFVWVPDFLNVESENSFWRSEVQGDYLYYMDYSYDEETETESTSLASVSILDGSAGPGIVLTGGKDDEDASEKDPEKDRSSRNIHGFMIDKEGGAVTVELIYHWSEDNPFREYYLCKYNAQGEMVSEQDFTRHMTGEEYIQAVAMDGEGRVYLACESAVYLLDAEGNFSGSIALDSGSWVRGMDTGKDGKVYLSLDGMNTNGTAMRQLDFTAKSLGETYNVDVSYHNNASVGLEKDFLLYDSNSLYEYDLETQTADKLLDWLDCDVDGNYVQRVHAMEDGRILVITYNYEDSGAEFVQLTKKPSAEVQKKTELCIGTLSMDGSLRSAAVKFNKSSDKYRITMRIYFDYNDVTYTQTTSNYAEVMGDALNRMNNDITSDNCPDLLVLNGLNTSRYASKGVFEDLNAYLETSAVLKRSDYFENILEAFTYDGVLVSIPKNFQMTSLVGKASDLGTEPGWTLEEMLAYGDKHPDAELFANYTRDRALTAMLRYNLGSYVDWESGKCSFDEESFVNILEFASRFPAEYVYDEDAPSFPVRIAAGEVLLDTASIYAFDSIQLFDAIFEGDVTFIGFPNPNGDSGTYFEASSAIAITGKCTDKEGAWAFMEHYLVSEDERYSFGLPSNKRKFAEAREEATKVVYVLDANGEPLLDENGEPVVEGGGHGVGYGNDWMYDYHITTEEEADRLEALIAIAKPATDSDTEIMNIISEETEAFFKGQQSAKDVAGIIQNRVQVYVNENR